MFNSPQTVDTRMAVIEEKFNVYEKMMTKLESAIQTISEINQNISRMLSVHEERLENCGKTDDMISRMISELKDENREQHDSVSERIDKIEVEVKEIGKIKWMTVGCGVLLAVLATAFSTLASGWWTPSEIQTQRHNQGHTHQQNFRN